MKEKRPLEIYKEYCSDFIPNSEGLKEWLSDVGTVFIQKSSLYVVLGNDLYQYKVFQGSHTTPHLTFIEKTSGGF